MSTYTVKDVHDAIEAITASIPRLAASEEDDLRRQHLRLAVAILWSIPIPSAP